MHVKDNLARVDYEKCIACGTCVKKCPVQVIHRVESQEEA
ncbi:MAG: 4Fe-4S binding protein [Loktanella sp.]|nr:4Fe-4S binding protein [Loktanella sp.]